MSQKCQWIVRSIFFIFMIYIYITVVSKNNFYSFLLLNSFLAYIPIEIAMHIDNNMPSTLLIIYLILWMLFYPNAPYVITDLFHLSQIDPYDPFTNLMLFNLHMWLNFTNLVFSVFLCSLLGMWSLSHVINIIMQKLHNNNLYFKIMLSLLLNIISSIGIYIGRFLRLHTAYFFLNPSWVFQQLIDMWNFRMLLFVILMTIIQFMIWLALSIYQVSLNNFSDNK